MKFDQKFISAYKDKATLNNGVVSLYRTFLLLGNNELYINAL